MTVTDKYYKRANQEMIQYFIVYIKPIITFFKADLNVGGFLFFLGSDCYSCLQKEHFMFCYDHTDQNHLEKHHHPRQFVDKRHHSEELFGDLGRKMSKVNIG